MTPTTFRFLATAVVVLFSAMSATSALAQESVDPEIQYIGHKYRVATFADLAHEKCGGLSDLGKTAARLAQERYDKQMTEAGLSAEADTYKRGAVSMLSNTNCNSLYQDPQVVSLMNEVDGLIDEYLLAILLSGVETCGDFDAEKTAAVMARAKEAQARLEARPDYASVSVFATAEATEFAEICVNPVVSDTFLMTQYPVSSIFVYAAWEQN